MARRALVEILGNAQGFKRATKESVHAADQLSHGLKKLSVDAKASANTQVAASIKRTDRMKREARAFREVASAAKKGSREQVEATNLAARSEAKLARAINKTNAEARHSVRLGRTLRGGGKEIRGGLASTGMAGGRALAFSSLGFLGAYGAGSILKSSITEASKLQEETEKTTVLFGKSEVQVAAWAKTLATSFGIGEGEALRSTGVFGNMFRSLHFGEAPASKMSERLVELAADMASFNNASPQDTLAALSSGLAGQVRPLRAYGVFLSQDRIKQEAVSSGMVKNAKHLTTAQKVQAAYNIILKDTALQHGDVARNTASLSVSQSKLKAALADSEAIIGRALLPELVKLSNRTAHYLEKLNRTGRLQRGVNSAVRVGKAVIGGLAAAIRPLVSTLQALSHVLGGAKNTARLFATVFIGMKILRWASEMRVLAGSLRAVAGAELLAGAAGGGVGGGAMKGLGRKLLLAAGLRGGVAGGAAALGTVGASVGLAGAAAVYSAGSEGGPTKGDPHFQENVGKRYPTLDRIGGDSNFPDSIPAKKRKRAFAIYTAFRKGQISKATAEKLLAALNPYAEKITGQGGNAGMSTRDSPGRQPGRFSTPAPTTAGGGGGGGGTAGHLGLKGQFDKLEMRLAKADLTSSPGDNRRVLTSEAANVRRQIKRLPQDHQHLQERTQLYQQLGQIQSSIQSIDQDAATKQKDAHDKQLALKKKERDGKKKHNDKVEAEEKKDREQEKKHREAMKKAQEAVKARMAQAVEGARSLIGDLFSGPVLNPSEAQRKRQLGVKNGPDAHKLVADVIAQTRAFRGTTRDLGVLRKSGASKQLIGELEGTDPEQLHALATASPKVRKQFLQAFAQRQKAIQSRARFDIHSPHVTVAAKRIDIGGEISVTVHNHNEIDGKQVSHTVTKHQRRGTQRNVAQRGGRHAGTNPHP